MTAFSCPNCEADIEVSEVESAAPVSCPVCGLLMAVPAAWSWFAEGVERPASLEAGPGGDLSGLPSSLDPLGGAPLPGPATGRRIRDG